LGTCRNHTGAVRAQQVWSALAYLSPPVPLRQEDLLALEDGIPTDPAALCFTPDEDVFVDGSVQGGRMPQVQQAACSAVQKGRDGKQRAFIASLSAPFSISSTYAEHAGVALAFRVLSVLPGDVLANISIVTDSANVCSASKRQDVPHDHRLWYSGFWRGPVCCNIQGVRKVQAHRPEKAAIEDGWHYDWAGNHAADLWAKAGVPGWAGDAGACVVGFAAQRKRARETLAVLAAAFTWARVEGIPRARQCGLGPIPRNFVRHNYEWTGS
jgi:hypothetical protein